MGEEHPGQLSFCLFSLLGDSPIKEGVAEGREVQETRFAAPI
jgi:hypothetical protein